ncbi:MAG TPA: hypothetical protein VH092_06250 [Urbifossiella sp.]|jgi:hypothetical protein|nr:hypothetical protein [Urbifossiella sp.]
MNPTPPTKSGPTPTPAKAKPEPKKHHKPPEFHDNVATTKGRLPDGSAFTLCYLAGDRRWAGELTIPGAPPFKAEASGAFQLLHDLDDLYRAWKQANPTPGPVPPAA